MKAEPVTGPKPQNHLPQRVDLLSGAQARSNLGPSANANLSHLQPSISEV